MRLRDCLMYLVGERRAILAIARSRGALAVGALLVLSGSIARNYDGRDLIGEWEVLLHGIGVSFGNALVLFSIVSFAALCANLERPRFWSAFLSFLGLFWMTAPMAWLYAVPYEQFQTPVDAIYSNAWTLAFVSVWRVALISRALQVIWGAPYWTVLCIVLLFSDVVVFIGTRASPTPMIDFMGGLQHSAEETALAGMNFSAMVWSMLAAPVLFIAALVGMAKFKGKWSVGETGERVSWGVWALPVIALAALAPAVWMMQPQQRARREVEEWLRAGEIERSFATMSRRERAGYPRVWDPPPRLAYAETIPSMDDVRRELAKGGQAAWVREVYLQKSWRDLLVRFYTDSYMNVAQLAEQVEIGHTLDDEQKVILRFHLDHDERMSPEDRGALERILNPTSNEGDESPPPG